MPFCPSALHAKNVGITVSCAKCNKPRLQYYKSNKIPEHEYNYKNDSVPSSSNSNQELNIYNINNESDNNMRSNENSKSVQSDKSDQEKIKLMK
ncbi:hypothetical protein C2G38_2218664 [Gigaspora rosea]|uniref:Uncharacterized protein n=1 Tax=Gigaspora rosea TaxID=44941 RepID=A0A397UAN2_9GLOM|nr:hypothetical protein C2G38_2218664 [Gigaspora rosea]